jgi:hypothetical protein
VIIIPAGPAVTGGKIEKRVMTMPRSITLHPLSTVPGQQYPESAEMNGDYHSPTGFDGTLFPGIHSKSPYDTIHITVSQILIHNSPYIILAKYAHYNFLLICITW